jgi:hypothetical protein
MNGLKIDHAVPVPVSKANTDDEIITHSNELLHGSLLTSSGRILTYSFFVRKGGPREPFTRWPRSLSVVAQEVPGRLRKKEKERSRARDE